MPRVWIDDQFHSHPKVQEAWRRDPVAVGLHARALSYAGDYLTDGFVPEAFVVACFATPARAERVVAVLLGAGLWEDNGEGGYLIHDYLAYNESRAHAQARRRADSARKRGGK